MNQKHLIPTPPATLIDALKNRRAIAIIGSGMSCASGGPTWKELLLGLAADAEKVAPDKKYEIAQSLRAIEEDKDFLIAASKLKDILQYEFTRYLKKHFNEKYEIKVDPKFLHKALNNDAVETLFSQVKKVSTRENYLTLSHRIIAKLPFRAIITTN